MDQPTQMSSALGWRHHSGAIGNSSKVRSRVYQGPLSSSGFASVWADEIRISSGSGAGAVEAASRYEAEVPELGLRFADEVERVIQLLLEHPELGSRLDDDLRHFVLRKFPF